MRNKAVYLALGIASDGTKDVLGIWIEQNEGAKFWLKVMNELRNRGVEDILIAVVDGLKGFPEAITTVFPLASVQTCIVHLSRYCLSFCGWKERQAVARELKAIYRAETAEVAPQAAQRIRRRPVGQKVSDDSPRAGAEIGNRSLPFTVIRRRCERSSTPPMRLKVCICSCARCSRIEGTSPATKRPRSSSIWPCATSPNRGQIHR